MKFPDMKEKNVSADAVSRKLAGGKEESKKHEKGESKAQERKEDMKKRGFRSPDLADALALTFASPVELRAWTAPIKYPEMGVV